MLLGRLLPATAPSILTKIVPSALGLAAIAILDIIIAFATKPRNEALLEVNNIVKGLGAAWLGGTIGSFLGTVLALGVSSHPFQSDRELTDLQLDLTCRIQLVVSLVGSWVRLLVASFRQRMVVRH
jgi:hypothetical protein